MIFAGVFGKLAERAELVMRGIDRNMFPGDVCAFVKSDSIAEGYNRLLTRFEGEWMVLLHDDTELLPGARVYMDEIRAAAPDDLGVVGVVGGRNLTSLEWWAAECCGRVRQNGGTVFFPGEPGPVDAVDGLFMLLSPAATRLRFDEGYTGFHGYDCDFSFQARAAGLSVVVAEVPLIHQTVGGFGDAEQWRLAAERFQTKWLT